MLEAWGSAGANHSWTLKLLCQNGNRFFYHITSPPEVEIVTAQGKAIVKNFGSRKVEKFRGLKSWTSHPGTFQNRLVRNWASPAHALAHSPSTMTKEFLDLSVFETLRWVLTYFSTLIPDYPTWRRVQMLPCWVIGYTHWRKTAFWWSRVNRNGPCGSNFGVSRNWKLASSVSTLSMYKSRDPDQCSAKSKREKSLYLSVGFRIRLGYVLGYW